MDNFHYLVPPDDEDVGEGEQYFSTSQSYRYVYYVCENNINDEIRCHLLSYFLSLSQRLKDFSDNIEDIVDPDLCPYRSPPHKSQQNELLYMRVRHLFQWMASTFAVDDNGRVRILSRIHNLPPKLSNAPIYRTISKIFESMVPSIKKYVEIRNSLQVCVRVKSYVLSPGEKYEEPYYKDGETDHIVAVGAYFLQLENGLAGALNFSPTQYFITIKQGKSVVFINKVPYSLSLSNNSHLERRFTVLYYYIVDPLSSLPSTKNLPSTLTVIKVLTQWGQNFGGELPKPIIKQIMSYIPFVWYNILEAKRFRKTFRDAMKSCSDIFVNKP